MHIHFSSLGSFLQDECYKWFDERHQKIALLGSIANDRKEIDMVLRGEVPCCRKLMWDSGAYSVSSKKTEITLQWYVETVKNIIQTDLEYDIVGLDVIGDANASQKNYMKLKHEYGFGTKFIPVYHYGEDIHYLDFLVKEGFEYIGLGGMGGINRVSQSAIRSWVKAALFENSDGRTLRYPHVRWHGFAMTSKETVNQFPFYSVDSAAWVKNSALGKLLTPFGEWRASNDPRAGADGTHILRAGKQTLAKIEEWLNSLGVTVQGVIDNRYEKHIANLNYFLWVERNHNWEPSNVKTNNVYSLLGGKTPAVSSEKAKIALTIKPKPIIEHAPGCVDFTFKDENVDSIVDDLVVREITEESKPVMRKIFSNLPPIAVSSTTLPVQVKPSLKLNEAHIESTEPLPSKVVGGSKGKNEHSDVVEPTKTSSHAQKFQEQIIRQDKLYPEAKTVSMSIFNCPHCHKDSVISIQVTPEKLAS